MGDPWTFILDRTLFRPRDVISFLNECLPYATGKSRLTWTAVHRSELEYSKNRLLALRDEWKPTFPDIGRLFEVFRTVPEEMTPGKLASVLDEGAMLLADQTFRGVRWLTDLTESLWSSGDDDDWSEIYGPLIRLLFDIGFLGLRRASKIFYAHTDPGFTDSQLNIAATTSFCVHPAFRPALEIGPARRGTT